MTKYTIYTDGGARGNPGPAGIGWVIFDADGLLVDFGAEYIGEATNNIAEYKALLAAISSLDKTDSELEIKMDSELIVKQLTGEYKIKNAELKIIAEKVIALTTKFSKVSYQHVPRAKNKFADKLVNIALDSKLA